LTRVMNRLTRVNRVSQEVWGWVGSG
jgi:hypothetical protein